MSDWENITHKRQNPDEWETVTPQKPKSPVDLGPGGMRESMRQVLAETSPAGAALAGIGTRVNDAAMRLKQIVSGRQSLTPKEAADIQAGRDIRAISPAAAVGGVAGDIAMTYPLAPTSLLGNVAMGATTGDLMNPLLPGDSQSRNIMSGAAGGGIGYGAMKALGLAAKPLTQSDDVSKLLSEGVVPTPGQVAASSDTVAGRTVGRAEEAVKSWPIVGDIVSNARRRAQEDLYKAGLKRATPQAQQVTQLAGRDALEETYGKISDAYGMALDRIGTVKVDEKFINNAPKIVERAAGLNPAQRADVSNIVEQTIASRINEGGGTITADIAKVIDSDLGALSRAYGRSSTASERLVGGVVGDIQKQWRDLIRRNAPDEATAKLLDDANRSFANYVRMERAMTKAGTERGFPTPAQLTQAVRETSGSPRQFAQGNALMQDLSAPALRVLGDTLPESGTIPRGLIALGALGAAGTNEYMGGPLPLTALALSPLLYSRTGARYMAGDLFPLTQGVLRKGADTLAPAAGILGRSYSQQNQ